MQFKTKQQQDFLSLFAGDKPYHKNLPPQQKNLFHKPHEKDSAQKSDTTVSTIHGGIQQIHQSEADELVLAKPVVRRVTFGMRNLGNTCFFNSVMQCLTHTRPLVNYCLNGTHKSQCKKSQSCFLCTYTEYLKVIQQGQRTQPQMIVHKLKSIWPRYSLGRQEDAHEFLILFMESLVNACFNMMKPPREFIYKNQNKTAVFQIVGGKSRSQVKCLGCGHCSNTYEDLATLSLEFPKRKHANAFTLEECLNHYYAPELLKGENKYMCSGCKKRQEARKRFSLEATPRTLMIHLKRFTNFGSKIGEFVRYPATLSLKTFMSSTIDQEKASSDNEIFDLYGVVVHQGGGCRSGHYFSYCKGFDGEWYDCNDDYVGRSSLDRVLKQQAYILFYQKRITAIVKEKAVQPKQSIEVVPKSIESGHKNLPGVVDSKQAKSLQQTSLQPELSSISTAASSNNMSDKEQQENTTSTNNHSASTKESSAPKVSPIEPIKLSQDKVMSKPAYEPKQESQNKDKPTSLLKTPSSLKAYEKKDEEEITIKQYPKPAPFTCLRKDFHPIIQNLNTKKRKLQATIDLIKMPQSSHRSALLLKRLKCSLNPEYVQPKLVKQGGSSTDSLM